VLAPESSFGVAPAGESASDRDIVAAGLGVLGLIGDATGVVTGGIVKATLGAAWERLEVGWAGEDASLAVPAAHPHPQRAAWPLRPRARPHPRNACRTAPLRRSLLSPAGSPDRRAAVPDRGLHSRCACSPQPCTTTSAPRAMRCAAPAPLVCLAVALALQLGGLKSHSPCRSLD
jgi:hypothetical protein